MDKNEFTMKLEEIDVLAERGDFEGAAAAADTVDWRRVKNLRTLCTVAEIYEACRRYDDSLAILQIAHKKSGNSKSVVYRLAEMYIRVGKFDEAERYIKEYKQLSPHDMSRYILLYKLARAKKAPLDDQIAILRTYKDREYTERWAYELARLYHQNGQDERCVAECDDMILWFSQGKYVLRAMDLKRQIQPLTEEQEALYNKEKERLRLEAEAVEAARLANLRKAEEEAKARKLKEKEEAEAKARALEEQRRREEALREAEELNRVEPGSTIAAIDKLDAVADQAIAVTSVAANAPNVAMPARQLFPDEEPTEEQEMLASSIREVFAEIRGGTNAGEEAEASDTALDDLLAETNNSFAEELSTGDFRLMADEPTEEEDAALDAQAEARADELAPGETLAEAVAAALATGAAAAVPQMGAELSGPEGPALKMEEFAVGSQEYISEEEEKLPEMTADTDMDMEAAAIKSAAPAEATLEEAFAPVEAVSEEGAAPVEMTSEEGAVPEKTTLEEAIAPAETVSEEGAAPVETVSEEGAVPEKTTMEEAFAPAEAVSEETFVPMGEMEAAAEAMNYAEEMSRKAENSSEETGMAEEAANDGSPAVGGILGAAALGAAGAVAAAAVGGVLKAAGGIGTAAVGAAGAAAEAVTGESFGSAKAAGAAGELAEAASDEDLVIAAGLEVAAMGTPRASETEEAGYAPAREAEESDPDGEFKTPAAAASEAAEGTAADAVALEAAEGTAADAAILGAAAAGTLALEAVGGLEDAGEAVDAEILNFEPVTVTEAADEAEMAEEAMRVTEAEAEIAEKAEDVSAQEKAAEAVSAQEEAAETVSPQEEAAEMVSAAVTAAAAAAAVGAVEESFAERTVLEETQLPDGDDVSSWMAWGTVGTEEAAEDGFDFSSWEAVEFTDFMSNDAPDAAEAPEGVGASGAAASFEEITAAGVAADEKNTAFGEDAKAMNIDENQTEEGKAASLSAAEEAAPFTGEDVAAAALGGTAAAGMAVLAEGSGKDAEAVRVPAEGLSEEDAAVRALIGDAAGEAVGELSDTADATDSGLTDTEGSAENKGLKGIGIAAAAAGILGGGAALVGAAASAAAGAVGAAASGLAGAGAASDPAGTAGAEVASGLAGAAGAGAAADLAETADAEVASGLAGAAGAGVASGLAGAAGMEAAADLAETDASEETFTFFGSKGKSLAAMETPTAASKTANNTMDAYKNLDRASEVSNRETGFAEEDSGAAAAFAGADAEDGSGRNAAGTAAGLSGAGVAGTAAGLAGVAGSAAGLAGAGVAGIAADALENGTDTAGMTESVEEAMDTRAAETAAVEAAAAVAAETTAGEMTTADSSGIAAGGIAAAEIAAAGAAAVEAADMRTAETAAVEAAYAKTAGAAAVEAADTKAAETAAGETTDAYSTGIASGGITAAETTAGEMTTADSSGIAAAGIAAAGAAAVEAAVTKAAGAAAVETAAAEAVEPAAVEASDTRAAETGAVEAAAAEAAEPAAVEAAAAGTAEPAAGEAAAADSSGIAAGGIVAAGIAAAGIAAAGAAAGLAGAGIAGIAGIAAKGTEAAGAAAGLTEAAEGSAEDAAGFMVQKAADAATLSEEAAGAAAGVSEGEIGTAAAGIAAAGIAAELAGAGEKAAAEAQNAAFAEAAARAGTNAAGKAAASGSDILAANGFEFVDFTFEEAAETPAAGQTGKNEKIKDADAFVDEILGAEKRPVEPRPLDATETELLSYFSRIPGVPEQVTSAMADVYNHSGERTSNRGNVLIMGRPGCGKSRLAEGMILAMGRDLGIKAVKSARLTAQEMNQKDAVTVIGKMSGGFLVIEAAGSLRDDVVEEMSGAMEFRTDGLVVILEDERKELRKMLGRHPNFARKFTSEVAIPVFTNDELVMFAKTYAKERGYKLDEMAVLALYTEIGENQRDEEPVTVGMVRMMVDRAINRTASHRFGRRRIVDTDGRIILREKDFDY